MVINLQEIAVVTDKCVFKRITCRLLADYFFFFFLELLCYAQSKQACSFFSLHFLHQLKGRLVMSKALF